MVVKIPFWATHVPLLWSKLEPRFRRIPKGWETDFKVGHYKVIVKVVNERPVIG